MIPKKIHYCWFGKGELPELALECIESWKTHLSDYEIILWDEENFDVTMNPYVAQAYEAEKYAFVSDYARFYALYHHGGIYLDTDVEVLKSLDQFLSDEAFMGFQNETEVAPGLIIGAKKNHPIMKEFMSFYETESFILDDGELNLTTVVEYATDILLGHGLIPNNTYQELEGIKIYPKTFFSPLTHNSDQEDFSKDTYSIHHFSASWMSDELKETHERIRRNREFIQKIIGVKAFYFLKKLKDQIKK